MDTNDATPVVIVNGRMLQVMGWCGPEIPQGWVPLDGRTIEGITLPDRRAKFVSAQSPDGIAHYELTEIVRVHDLVIDGDLKIRGIMP